LEALAGLMRLLRRRRWPEGVTALISMSSGPRPAPAPGGDWGSGTAAADTVGSPARLVAAVACLDGEGAAGGRGAGSGAIRESEKPFCERAGGGGGPGKGVLDGEGIGMAWTRDEASSWSQSNCTGVSGGVLRQGQAGRGWHWISGGQMSGGDLRTRTRRDWFSEGRMTRVLVQSRLGPSRPSPVWLQGRFSPSSQGA
jgi:hypothetical protein